MSLFHAREWWAQGSTDEEYVKGSMCIGNVDNDKSGGNKIVVGSLSGYLRVYYPRQAEYKIEDLMLEQQLGEPILQVELVRVTHLKFISLIPLSYYPHTQRNARSSITR